ncbi:MAG TPA: hypothetical protein VK356_10360, partial [Thermomicrobiales bacterium]|nr:hypothetical protein [Thermomicrobiales bacterium]
MIGRSMRWPDKTGDAGVTPSGRLAAWPSGCLLLDISRSRVLDLTHSGILPCLRSGVDARLERASASARISQG